MASVRHWPWSLVGLFAPGSLFALGLFFLRGQPRFSWVAHPSEYPWQLWAIAAAGFTATAGGFADWRLHRSGAVLVGPHESRCELLALVGGGLPLFFLMSWASLARRPEFLLLPILAAALATTALICYDEFVFHSRRCGRYETLLHRLLVFGNGAAWLAWMHWCFVREGLHA